MKLTLCAMALTIAICTLFRLEAWPMISAYWALVAWYWARQEGKK